MERGQARTNLARGGQGGLGMICPVLFRITNAILAMLEKRDSEAIVRRDFIV